MQNRLIQTSQTGGQWYSDTSPLSIPCWKGQLMLIANGIFDRLSFGELTFGRSIQSNNKMETNISFWFNLIFESVLRHVNYASSVTNEDYEINHLRPNF
jgi:hypothetical protein